MNPPPAKADEINTASTPRRACRRARSVVPSVYDRKIAWIFAGSSSMYISACSYPNNSINCVQGENTSLCTDTAPATSRDHQVDRAKHVVRPVLIAIRHVRVQPEVERVLQSTHTVGIIVVDLVGIDVVERRATSAVRGEVMHVVIRRTTSRVTVAKVDGLAPVRRRCRCGRHPCATADPFPAS